MHPLASARVTALVEAAGLTRHFGGTGWFARPAVQAVRDVSFTIGRGEAVGLVGESGSGKSTIGRLLIGQLAPSAGHVSFDGTDLSAISRAGRRSLRRRIQLVFQDPYASLDPRRRVGRQIADGFAIHGIARPAERITRVAALLQQVGLPADAARRFPHEFSGGQRQRIAIARALAPGPDLLVADEPVSALDVSIQAQIIRLLADLRQDLGLTLLFISHDLPVVRALCERVIVLYLGRIMEIGPASRIFASPAHPYTQALLAASPSMQSGALPSLAGEPPSPANPPSGCVFRTRCRMATQECGETVPTLQTVGAGHQAACLKLG